MNMRVMLIPRDANENPVLIGEAGWVKPQVVGLAQIIATNVVPNY